MDQPYRKALGARILGAANSLKRTPEALAREPGLPESMVHQAIAGEAGADAALKLLHRMEYIYTHGDASVLLRWGWGQEALLDPGDSASVEPMVPHASSRCGR